MGEIGIRIRDARKELRKTQREFAESLGMSENYIWQIEKGQREPSDRTIADICRVFHVNEAWIRIGEGDPFTPLSRFDELADIFAAVQVGKDDKSRLIRAMAMMPDEAFPAFVKFLEQLHETLSEE